MRHARSALLAALWLCIGPVAAENRAPEERAIDAIRRDAAPDAGVPGEHPLPLVSGWMDGRMALGFSPDYQLDQIRRGRYLLPWFSINEDSFRAGAGEPYPDPHDASYYEPAIQYLAQHHLPLTFVSEEWEVLMPKIFGEQGALSPSTPTATWYALGCEWAHHKTLRRLQQLYPDPPLLLIVLDSEYPKLTANELDAAYVPGDAHSMARRRALGDAWIDRYSAMLRGFRDALESPGWRAHLVVSGYDQFVPSALGRWPGWTDYSMYVPGRMEPWPFAWDGVSVSFYQHNLFPDSDFTVWSPQIESMNYVPELAEVRARKPQFWFEMSTWDGQEPGDASDKLAFYAARGQHYSARRYGGAVQFGMWLLRPRVVREFRNPDHDRIRVGAYFEALLDAVSRVHDDSVLRDFWLHATLLPNPVGGHPYQSNVSGELAARPRWFLLDSPQNPPRPWQLETPLRVYSLALQNGRAPHRQWLVYAFAPRDEQLQAEVTIPRGPPVSVLATPGGCFTLIQEGEPSGRIIASSADSTDR